MSERKTPPQLRQYLVDNFDLDEIMLLCLEFADWENISGDTKEGKALQLIQHQNRRGTFDKLQEAAEQMCSMNPRRLVGKNLVTQFTDVANQAFSMADVIDLCTAMQADPSNIGGNTKVVKIANLWLYCTRRGSQRDLLNMAAEMRPSYTWPTK